MSNACAARTDSCVELRMNTDEYGWSNDGDMGQPQSSAKRLRMNRRCTAGSRILERRDWRGRRTGFITTHLRAAMRRFILLSLCLCAAAVQSALAQETIPRDEAVERALNAPWLTDEERATLRVFHGRWDEDDLINAELRAIVALNAWRLDDDIFDNPEVPVELRAEALLRAGELREAIGLLDGAGSIHAARIRAEAFEQLGEFARASEAVADPVARLLAHRLDDAADLTEGVLAMLVRARVAGQPSRDFQTMMAMIGRAHQELDRLYWPARVVEAQILIDKDRRQAAIEALREAMAQNPRASDVWFMLGSIALAAFNFDAALSAVDELRALNKAHPLADLLQAEMRLVQDDPDGALEILDPLIADWPRMRPAIALAAAAHAIRYDEDAMEAALGQHDALAPGSARAYYTVGRMLSFNRQYDAAARVLEEAIQREPAWPPPQIELGLMEMQSGRDHRAHDLLRQVRELDPFNYRVTNSLTLLDEIIEYEHIETDHFIIRHKPGIDRVVADLMPDRLEALHEIVTQRLQFEPDRKTVIELMPDHHRFAVRIAGMPHIHTIAACTGPVIALEVPREGRQGQHSGPFDWPRVLQHEYTHTVTLAQTRNRIPHWLTEAAAVDMERAPRNYQTHQLLASAHEAGELFSLDDIKWAFVRPRRPHERGLAYAQGHWMVQYMNQTFGEAALIRLLARYFEGEREEQAMRSALGVTRDEFFTGFLEWAAEEVKSWGMAGSPTIAELIDAVSWDDPELAVDLAASKKARLDAIARRLLDEIGRPAEEKRGRLEGDDWPALRKPRVRLTPALIEHWLMEHPDHPDLLELHIRHRDDAGAAEDEMIPLLERYAALRPVDPMPHEQLARIYLASDHPTDAIPHLEYLDAREENSPVFAAQLARQYRDLGDLDRAMAKAARAVNINPYHAANRELTAAVAIQQRDYETAKMHLEALTLIEPDRPRHAERLAALEKLRTAAP